MRRLMAGIVLLAASAGYAAGARAQDMPFAGKWKADMERSDFGQLTTIIKQQGDETRVAVDNRAGAFGLDGKAVTTPLGGVSSTRQLTSNSWVTVTRVNGRIVAHDTMRLSADGRTLTSSGTRVTATGEAVPYRAERQRVSEGSGLSGQWRTARISHATAQLLVLTAVEGDELRMEIPDVGGTCAGSMDGTEHPARGAMWPDGFTCAFKRLPHGGFENVVRSAGKVMLRLEYTLSEDGETLTEVSEVPGLNERVTVVYSRM